MIINNSPNHHTIIFQKSMSILPSRKNKTQKSQTSHTWQPTRLYFSKLTPLGVRSCSSTSTTLQRHDVEMNRFQLPLSPQLRNYPATQACTRHQIFKLGDFSGIHIADIFVLYNSDKNQSVRWIMFTIFYSKRKYRQRGPMRRGPEISEEQIFAWPRY